jgi:hypothetical protein
MCSATNAKGDSQDTEPLIASFTVGDRFVRQGYGVGDID